MDGPKLRVIVEIPAYAERPLSRLVIPIAPTQSVAHLSTEIIRRQGFSKAIADDLTLSLSDGSQLFSEDQVGDVIRADEAVYARLGSQPLAVTTATGTPISSTPSSSSRRAKNKKKAKKPAASEREPAPAQPTPAQLNSNQTQLKRVRIALLTPELARNGGKDESKQILAFGGSAVSVKLSMGEVRREVARTLGWLDDRGTLQTARIQGVSDGNRIRGSCACTIANEIHTQGRFEQLHCPREIDGSPCRDSKCCYSHVAIGSGLLTTSTKSLDSLECKLCTELFGFPCEKCIEKAHESGGLSGAEDIKHCPLVQNAGCGHVFHAHCYFARTSSAQGCPAGCPRSSISAEAVPFDLQKPHLVVVHSGSVIEKVPIPDCYLTARGGMITLNDIQVVYILTSKYPNLGTGLTVRMYGRANTGVVSFRHSTIVSICCASRHVDVDGIRRFELNGPFLPSPDIRTLVDLHTWSSPIFDQSPQLTIEDLGLDQDVRDGEAVTLFAMKRPTSKPAERKGVGKAAVYTLCDDWHPIIRQSSRGMAAFLSALLVFVNYLSVSGKSTEEKNMQYRMFHHLLALTQFPPAVRALYILTLNETLHPEEMRVLSETFYHLALNVVHPHATMGDPARVFEGARLLFGVLIERTKVLFALPGFELQVSTKQPFQTVSLTWKLSGEPLHDPVLLDGGIVVERQAALIRQKGGSLFNPSLGDRSMEVVSNDLVPLIRRTAARSMQLVVLDGTIQYTPILSRSFRSSRLGDAIDMANVELQIYAPLSLQQNVVTPALTLDEVGYNTVFISRGGPCAQPGEDIFFLRPCHGGEVGVDVNLVAMRLQPIIEARKRAGEWDIDAFGAARTDRLDTREVEEAIVVALDLSRSMEEDFNTNDHDNRAVEDHDQIAARNCMDHFFQRCMRRSEALQSAKVFISGLDCIPNITRFICHGERDSGFWGMMQTAATRRERAENVVDELKVIYTRLWQRSQSSTPGSQRMLYEWEDFVALAGDATLKSQLVDILIQRTALSKQDTNLIMSNGIPVRFIDPLSGCIFTDPVRASDGFVYERRSIEAWRDAYSTSPLDPTVDIDTEAPLLPVSNLVHSIMEFLHGRPRASFPHQKPFLIQASDMFGVTRVYVTLPGSTSILSLLFDQWSFSGFKPSASRLWQGLKDYGDGSMRGTALEPRNPLNGLRKVARDIGSWLSLNMIELHCRSWQYIPTPEERIRIDSRSMSRLDVVKQAFEALVNKSEAFSHPVAIGLVTFGREVRKVQDITLLKEQFRNTLRTVEADGDTPLFDSLLVAQSMLESFKLEHPSTSLRIICLTDGFDIGSKTTAHVAAAKLQRSGIVVDSIVVQTGGRPNVLHPISTVTGGYSFKVDTLENALNIMELETVLFAKDRLERPRMPIVKHQWHLSQYNDLRAYPMDVVTSEKCPDRKPHVRLHEPMRSAHRVAARGVLPSSTDRQRRLMQEIRDIVNNPHPFVDVYTGDDLAFWKIVIEAPRGSPYDGGTFLAYIDFGKDYPQAAPEVRFMTPILHPNINRHGKVCHAALDRSWLVDMTMNVVLQILYGLLLTPDTDNPLDLHATMEYNDDSGQHAMKVHNMVQKFASKNREAWRKELESDNV